MNRTLALGAFALTLALAHPSAAQPTEETIAPVEPAAAGLTWHIPDPRITFQPPAPPGPPCIPKERRSVGLMIAGIVVSSLSWIPLVAGVAVFGEDGGRDAAPLAAGGIATAVLLAGGITMAVVGAKWVPIEGYVAPPMPGAAPVAPVAPPNYPGYAPPPAGGPQGGVRFRFAF